MSQVELHDISPNQAKRYAKSLEASRSRREEAKAKERQLKKHIRRVGAGAVAIALGAGGVVGINALTSRDGSPKIDHRITVQYGDTLSEISEKTLMEAGNPDPSTQEINKNITTLEEVSPDLQDGSAGTEDVINVPENLDPTPQD